MSAIPADLRMPSPWRAALAATAGVLGAILLLYRDTALGIVDIWSRSETFAHGFLVVPISLWLIWRRREHLQAMLPQAQPAWLLALAGAAAVWLLADVVVVNAAAQFALVAMVVLAVPAVLGTAVALAILFPLLFLFFAVPFGEFMLPTMMQWTADFAVAALQASGIPVYREGLHFVLPSGSWSVVEECSGVRYLIASFMVGSLFAYLNYRSWRRRAVFMLVALLVPVVANWLRAYLIVMLGHLSGNRLAAGVDHILYGWVFFGIVIAVMFAIGMRWAEPDDVPAPGSQPAAARSSGRVLLATALAAAAIVPLPALLLGALQRAEAAAAPARLDLPEQLSAGWSADATRLVDWRPIFAAPSVEAARRYAGPEGTVGVYVAYYRGQQHDRKLVSSANMLVASTDKTWILAGRGRTSLPDGTTLPSADIVAQQGLAGRRVQLLAWRLYWIDGRYVGGDVRAKLATAVSRLRGRGDDGAAVVLFTEATTPQAADATLQRFAAANLQKLDGLLRRTRDAR